MNRMMPNDVAIAGDVNETFSRDFLRALQEFRPGQDCFKPKVLGSTAVFKSTPECITKGRRWHHPGERF